MGAPVRHAPVPALLAVALLAVPPLLDLRRASTRALLAGLAAGLGLQLSWLLPLTPLHAPEAAASARCAPEHRLSLVVASLRASASGVEPFLEQVRRADPDLIFAVEIDPGRAEALAPLAARYPHRVVHPRADYWGFALYSRFALERPEVRRLLSDYAPRCGPGSDCPPAPRSTSRDCIPVRRYRSRGPASATRSLCSPRRPRGTATPRGRSSRATSTP